MSVIVDMSKAGKRKKNVTEESAPQSNTKRKRTEKKIEVPVAEPTTSEAGTTQESLSSLVRDASWATNLRDLFNTDNFKQIEQFLNTQWTARKAIFPPKALIFEAFNRTPFDKVKVIILGQDPYHDNGQVRSERDMRRKRIVFFYFSRLMDWHFPYLKIFLHYHRH